MYCFCCVAFVCGYFVSFVVDGSAFGVDVAAFCDYYLDVVDDDVFDYYAFDYSFYDCSFYDYEFVDYAWGWVGLGSGCGWC